jgi:hypothetical protein
MRFADYDHDGRASEFVFQMDAAPCAKKMCVVVGISRKNSRLHIFSSVDRPQEPLILRDSHWEALARASGPITATNLACFDHGSDVVVELELKAVDGSIWVSSAEYQCSEEGARGGLISREPL